MDGIAVADGQVMRGPKTHPVFSYEEAFSRNLGWLTEWEQQALRYKRVAIAGMGGVGGFHLLTLVRFGIGAFNIADGDAFDLVNFNRQAGATLDSIGQSKVAVMIDSARQINPDVRIHGFDQGVTAENLNAFLEGVDLCIDGLDFFTLDIRRRLNARCRELGIPVINAAPLGMGTAFLIFMPDGVSFEEWFRLDGLSEEQQYVSYLVGMAPRALHRGYLVDPSRVDLRGHRGPSTVAACELCAAVAGVEAIKLLLGRGRTRAAPYYHQFDPYRGRWILRRLRGGNRHPIQRLKIALTRRLAAKLSQAANKAAVSSGPMREIEKILDYARWAPSGDNTQPWRFTIVDDDRVTVFLTRLSDDLYDYRDGEPTLLSGGTLLESIRIAASFWSRGFDWEYRGRRGDTHQIDVSLPRRPEVAADPLLSQLPLRSVDRRSYRLRRLSPEQKAALAATLGADLRVEWYEPLGQRWRMARLGAKATSIRLMTPEAFRIHQRVLDFNDKYSTTGVPATSSGISRASVPLMRWAMRSWRRMRLLNGIGGGVAGAVQMDYLPGLFSAAFFTISRTRPDASADPAIAALVNGQSLQRFWLTATRLGLAVQPAMAILIFADYGRRDEPFTTNVRAQRRAKKLAQRTGARIGTRLADVVFVGRIGLPVKSGKSSRSVRLPLAELAMRDVRFPSTEIAGTRAL